MDTDSLFAEIMAYLGTHYCKMLIDYMPNVKAYYVLIQGPWQDFLPYCMFYSESLHTVLVEIYEALPISVGE